MEQFRPQRQAGNGQQCRRGDLRHTRRAGPSAQHRGDGRQQRRPGQHGPGTGQQDLRNQRACKAQRRPGQPAIPQAAGRRGGQEQQHRQRRQRRDHFQPRQGGKPIIIFAAHTARQQVEAEHQHPGDDQRQHGPTQRHQHAAQSPFAPPPDRRQHQQAGNARKQDPAGGRGIGDDAHKGRTGEHGVFCAGGQFGSGDEITGDGQRAVPQMLQRALVQALCGHQWAVIAPGIADEGKIQSGLAAQFHRREIRIVGQAFIEGDSKAAGRSARRHGSEAAHQIAVLRTGLEHHRPAAAAARFQIDRHADARCNWIGRRTRRKDGAGADQAQFFGIGEQQHQIAGLRGLRNGARHFQRGGDTGDIIGRTGRGPHRIMVRQQRDGRCSRVLAGAHRDKADGGCGRVAAPFR